MERGFGWHYPPGTPGPSHSFMEAKCTNEDCDSYDEVVEITGKSELGAFYADDDDDFNCKDCGREMKDV